MYRKMIIVISLSLAFVVNPVTAQQEVAVEGHEQLSAKLENMQSLQGSFRQEIYDNNELLQEATGRFYLERPARLRWITDEPDDSVLVADGETIYYYNPFIEQVTLYTQAEAMQANPLLLLLDSSANWDAFTVTQIAEVPADNSYLNFWQIEDRQTYGSSLTLGFEDNQLQQLIVDDGQGQKSVFYLQNTTDNIAIDESMFTFTIEPGVDVDDQRE